MLALKFHQGRAALFCRHVAINAKIFDFEISQRTANDVKRRFPERENNATGSVNTGFNQASKHSVKIG